MSTLPTTLPDPLAVYQSGPFKRFTNPYTQAALDSALAEADADDPVVIVAHHLYNTDGTKIENRTMLSAVVRLPAGLSLMVGGFKDWTKPLDQGVEGKLIWKPKFGG
jgi:hypothetical protein